MKIPQLGARLRASQVERRPDEDVPEAVDRALALAEPAQDVGERLAVVLPRVELLQPEQRADEREPLPHAQVAVAQQRVGPLGDRGDPAALVDHRQREPDPPHRRRLTGERDELRPRGEAGERDVLAVVGRRRGVALPLGQRLHRAAEGRPRLEHGHLVALLAEPECGREAREAAAYHDDSHRSSPPPTIASLRAAERCGLPAKTS